MYYFLRPALPVQHLATVFEDFVANPNRAHPEVPRNGQLYCSSGLRDGSESPQHLHSIAGNAGANAERESGEGRTIPRSGRLVAAPKPDEADVRARVAYAQIENGQLVYQFN